MSLRVPRVRSKAEDRGKLTPSRRHPDPLRDQSLTKRHVSNQSTTMPSPAEVYRQKAAECEQWAESAADTLAKQTFRDLAEQWLRLAALVEAQEKSEWY